MKKTLRNRIFGVIVTMVLVLSLAIPTQAMAATLKITQKNGKAVPATIYTKQSYTLKVSGATVKFYSNNKKVAVITTTGKLTAKAPGTVKISAKNKKGKVVATKTIKVNQRCTQITSNIPELTLIAGETATLKGSKTPSTSTDVVRYYSADQNVATVNLTTGNVTAVAAGTTTIKIIAKATKATSNSNKYNKVATVNVTVKEAAAKVTLTAVQQTELNKIRLTFNGTPSATLVPQEFLIIDPKTFETVVVSSAELVPSSNKDINYVDLTTRTEMKDSKEYNVTYQGATVSFTATDGKPVNYMINPQQVEVNVPTPIYLNILDSKNVIIYKGLYNATNPYNVTCNLTYTDGAVTKEGLVLNSLNSTVKMDVITHTGTYDKDTKEITKTTTFTMYPVSSNPAAAAAAKYHIGKSGEAVDFNKAGFVPTTTIAVGDTTQSLFVNLENCLGQSTVDYSKYSVISSDTSMLIISGKLTSKTSGINIVAMKDGVCNIVLKDADGKLLKAFPVTIVKAGEASKLTFDNEAPFIASTEVAGTATNVTVSLKDQYGTDFPGFDTSKLAVKCTQTSSGIKVDDINKNLKDYVTISKNVLSFSAVKKTNGYYNYEVSYNDIKATIVVTIKDAVGTPSYALTIDPKVVKLPADAADTKTIEVPIYFTYKIGDTEVKKVKVSEDNTLTVKIIDSQSKDLTSLLYKDGSFVAQKLDGKVLAQAPVGSYTVVVSIKDQAVASDTILVVK